ncbi:MAG: PEP-CTERM sorting domain-containing protein [Planctomycetota bacterium]
MRSFAISLVLAAVFVFAAAQPALGDAFTIDEWGLTTLVQTLSAGQDAEFSVVVENPFQVTHFASMGNSTSETVYDFAWGEQFGQFMIQGAQQAEDSGGGSLIYTSSEGHIIFTNNSDNTITVTVEAEYAYDLPAYGMTAYVWILFADFETHEHYFAAEEWEDTFLGGPKQGTFTMGGEGFIPAGREVYFGYTMKVDADGSTGTFATGDGHITFTITPEPTTASLLALGAFMLVRRRRCGRK